MIYTSVKSILLDVGRTIKAQILKLKYKKTLLRLRYNYGNRKIVVAFCVSEIAKWKCQSLYDCLEKSERFLPLVYVYPSPLDFNNDSASIGSLLNEKINFFEAKKMQVINVWDTETNKCIIPKSRYADIIFYQQPWDTPPFPLPINTADFALSFYIPYYLVNNFDINLEFGQRLHYQIYGYIVQNETLAELYTSMLTKRYYAGKCFGLGHTIVDYLNTKHTDTKNNSVIYAPHFSFPVPGKDRVLTYSTFLENGKLILAFAKQHPEIEWIFKPHPRLRLELEQTGVWTKEEIECYYDEWGKIGVVCTSSDYAKYFQNSFAMITDCGSFLTEYSCMDKPLIRLYYHKENLEPNPILEKLYSTFYYAHNNVELIELLETIINKRRDPKLEIRHEAVTSLGLNRIDSAEKIVAFIDSLLNSRYH